MLQFIQSPTFRRIVVALVSLGVVALNKKLGLDLNADEIAGFVVVVVAYLVQSVFRTVSEVKVAAQVEAAKAITTVDQAAAELRKPAL